MSHVKGILDLLDQIDRYIGQLDLVETLDPSRIRQNQILARNARAGIHEIRRRIERTGEETPT